MKSTEVSFYEHTESQKKKEFLIIKKQHWNVSKEFPESFFAFLNIASQAEWMRKLRFTKHYFLLFYGYTIHIFAQCSWAIVVVAILLNSV